jgi:hypothetical protein
MTNAITSVAANGTANSGVSAGSAIASIDSSKLGRPGNYRFRIRLSALAAGAAADMNNIVLTLGSSTFVVPFVPAAGPQNEVVVNGLLDGATGVSLNTGANVSTIAYYGSIQAEYVG